MSSISNLHIVMLIGSKQKHSLTAGENRLYSESSICLRVELVSIHHKIPNGTLPRVHRGI